MSSEQLAQLDYVYKKDIFSVVKTDDVSKTRLTADAEINYTSPLVSASNVWVQSALLNGGLATASGVVTQRQYVKLTSVHGVGNSQDFANLVGVAWSSGITNWVSPSYHPDFNLQFLVGPSGAIPPTGCYTFGSTPIYPFIFDYTSGILTFTKGPAVNSGFYDLSAITTGGSPNYQTTYSIWVSGYTYSGKTLASGGLSSPGPTGQILFYDGVTGSTGNSNMTFDTNRTALLSTNSAFGGTQTYQQTSYGSGQPIGTVAADFSGGKGYWKNVSTNWKCLGSKQLVPSTGNYTLGLITADFIFSNELNATFQFNIIKGGGGGGSSGYVKFMTSNGYYTLTSSSTANGIMSLSLVRRVNLVDTTLLYDQSNSDVYSANYGITVVRTPTSLQFTATGTFNGPFTYTATGITVVDLVQLGNTFNGGSFAIQNWTVNSYGTVSVNSNGNFLFGNSYISDNFYLTNLPSLSKTSVLGYDTTTGKVSQQPTAFGNDKNVIYNNNGVFAGSDYFNFYPSTGTVVLLTKTGPYTVGATQYQISPSNTGSYFSNTNSPITTVNTSGGTWSNFSGMYTNPPSPLNLYFNQTYIEAVTFAYGSATYTNGGYINCMFQFQTSVDGSPAGSFNIGINFGSNTGNYTLTIYGVDNITLTDPNSNVVYSSVGLRFIYWKVVRTSVSYVFLAGTSYANATVLYQTPGVVFTTDSVIFNLTNSQNFYISRITDFKVYSVTPGTPNNTIESYGPVLIDETSFPGSTALTVKGPVSLIGLTGPTGGANLNVLAYDNTSGVVSYSAKSFVIHHPIDTSKYLVHACLEGPEAGVYYRGKSEVVDDEVTVELPDYVSRIATDFTVHITTIHGKGTQQQYASEVEDNKFKVFGKGKFFWIVYGKRLSIDVEPSISSSSLQGKGPYLWLENQN